MLSMMGGRQIKIALDVAYADWFDMPCRFRVNTIVPRVDTTDL